MARFRGILKGQSKTAASRRGSKSSGLEAILRGERIGVRVVLRLDGESEVAEVYRLEIANRLKQKEHFLGEVHVSKD